MAGSRSSTAILARLATLTLILVSALGTDELRGGAPPYTVTDLGIFGTVQSAQAFDVNDAGQAAGIAGNRAFLWQHGTKTDLGTLGSGSSAVGPRAQRSRPGCRLFRAHNASNGNACRVVEQRRDCRPHARRAREPVGLRSGHQRSGPGRGQRLLHNRVSLAERHPHLPRASGLRRRRRAATSTTRVWPWARPTRVSASVHVAERRDDGSRPATRRRGRGRRGHQQLRPDCRLLGPHRSGYVRNLL